MLTSFWTGMSGKLAERGVAAILSPAFLFWAGGVAAAGQIDDLAARFGDLTGAEQGAAVVGGFLLVALSGIVAQALALPTLRLLEGYWPRPLDPLRHRLTAVRSRRLDEAGERWRALALARHTRVLSPSERDEYARLERLRQQGPTRAELRMPTRLGNVLRAAEARPGERYGLDAIVCWPRLWMVLPETARTEVGAARQALDARVEVWIWSVLFCAWVPLAWWAAIAGIVVATAAYKALVSAAATYGQLVVATYDLYRAALYTALRVPLPGSLTEERAAGAALTRYLSRGVPPAAVPTIPAGASSLGTARLERPEATEPTYVEGL